MLYNKAISQTHGGVEQYYYAGHNGISAIAPKAYYQNKKNWYAEVTYNYNEAETFAVNAGKTFSKENAVSYSITPVAGVMAGKLNGASLGLDMELDYKKIFFSAESQYTFSARNRNEDFFFNWSEAAYQFTDHLFSGVALQITHLYKTSNKWEPGIMTGFSFNKWTFPLYVFNPAARDRYFVLGINIEWGQSKNKSNEKNMPLLTKTDQSKLQ